jgi:predicted ester cyclase
MTGVEATVQRYYDGVCARDAAAATASLAPGCRIEIPGATLPGPPALAAWMDAFFTAFPDIQHRVAALDVVGDRASTTLEISGTHTGPLVAPDGTLPPTGRSISFRAVNELRVTGDRIDELRIAFDPGELMAQLS